MHALQATPSCPPQKKKQKRTPQQRTLVLEDYCKHIMLQWFDRGVGSDSTELSRTCRRMLDMGSLLNMLARQSSFWFICVDAVDQAKFRVPRVLTKTHAFDKLIRPALHVQGLGVKGLPVTVLWQMLT